MYTGNTENPSTVLGVHGTEGRTCWKCLARRPGLHGPWEAVEWARVPAGGKSGEHRHSRTEELYFVLAGDGEMQLNGVSRPVGQHDLILTGLGATHGLSNTGNDDLEWLVVEMLSPDTDAALSLRDESTEEAAGHTRIVNLGKAETVDTTGVFQGPLRRISIEAVPSHSTRNLAADSAEYTVFILEGRGHAQSGETTFTVAPGRSITLPLNNSMTLSTEQDELRYFLARVDVEVGGPR